MDDNLDDQRVDNAEVVPLQKWKNAPELSDLKADLENSRTNRNEQVAKIDRWLENLRVEGSAKANAPKGNSQIVPKLIRKQAEWRYAALSEPFLSTDDLFRVRPRTWEDKEAAMQNQIVLSHQFNTQIDKVRFFDTFVRAAVDEGTVIVKVGWEFEEETYEEEVPIVQYVENPEMAPLYEHLSQLQQESPSEYHTDVPDELKEAHAMVMESGVPIEVQILGYEMATKTRTVKNAPTLEVCDYRNLYVDPTCGGDLEKASFVIYSFESSKAALEKDGKYKNLDKIDLENSSVLNDPDHAASKGNQNFQFRDKSRKKFVVFEYWGYWDIEGDGKVVPIVAAWVGNTLIRLEENPFPDKKIPFVSSQYLPVRNEVYGEPDGELLSDNQQIIGAVTRGMIDILAKSANGQTGMAKNFLDATNKRRYERGDNYEFNPNADPRTHVHMHTFPDIPQSAQYILDMQQLEAESLTGVKAYSQGISGASLGQVASLGRGALDAAARRELGILRRLAECVVKIGRKIISMNSEFLSDEEVVRLTNDELVLVKRDDLAGYFDLRLTISTAEEDEKKAQELAFMLQTTGNTMDPMMMNMILADIADLRKMPDLAKRIREYQPQPDPIQQEMAQIELELKRAELDKTRAEIQKIMSDAQLSSTKAGTEVEKAQNIRSDTDQKDLDFVEQESGVKQARDLEKHGEQARSQAQLKLLDHQLNEQTENRNLLREYMINRGTS